MSYREMVHIWLVYMAVSLSYTVFGFAGLFALVVVMLIVAKRQFSKAKAEQKERMRQLKEEYSKGR